MTMETSITIEPIPANPGYVADITGHLSDPEIDPRGTGATRMAAALDLARSLLQDAHPCTCLAIAAVLREEMFDSKWGDRFGEFYGAANLAFERAIRAVEGIA